MAKKIKYATRKLVIGACIEAGVHRWTAHSIPALVQITERGEVMSDKCKSCEEAIGFFTDYDGYCKSCYPAVTKARQLGISVEELLDREAAAIEEEEAFAEHLENFLVTTETAVPDLVVEERLGVVTAEVVIGMHLFKDISVGVRNTVGGRSETYQKDLREMREQALEEIKREAATLGANAVIAMDLDYQEIGSKASSMLMLVASGTAVKIRETQQ